MLQIQSILNFSAIPTYNIYCDEPINIVNTIHSMVVDNNTSELFCKSTTVDGVYSIGCKQLKDNCFKKAGYVWSSRPGCINAQFNTQLVDVVINNSACWVMDINLLKTLVEEYTGKQHKIEKYCNSYYENMTEPNYGLVEITK